MCLRTNEIKLTSWQAVKSSLVLQATFRRKLGTDVLGSPPNCLLKVLAARTIILMHGFNTELFEMELNSQMELILSYDRFSERFDTVTKLISLIRKGDPGSFEAGQNIMF